MRRLGRWGLGVALVVCLSATAVAADTDAASSSDSGWFSRWFGGGKKAPEKTADDKKADRTEHPVKPDPNNRPETPAVDPMTAERAREEANLLRRLLVCDKLEEMTSDPDVLRQIDELRQRIRMTYAQHTAYMPAAGARGVDEETLEKHLGTGPTAGRRAEAPAYTVHGEDSIGRTASVEDPR